MTPNGLTVNEEGLCPCCLEIPDPEYHRCFEDGGCDGPDECRGLIERAEWRDFGEGD